MKSIEILDCNTISLLRSSLIIPNLTSILNHLINNSIDSNSNKIISSINLNKWSITCKDNGQGFNQQNLNNIQRYSTSSTKNTFGFRGEALASIAHLASLEISTKPTHQDDTFSIIIRGESKLFKTIPNSIPNSTGTTVSVKDIFYNV
jgi:DNA mismatch repair ATPase MutL